MSSDEELQIQFESASKHVASKSSQYSSEILLYFYARYKQVNCGPCTPDSKPGFFDFTGKQKWQAWNSMGDKSKNDAMIEYVAKVQELDPEWTAGQDEDGEEIKDPSWVSVSCMMRDEDDNIPDNQKTIINWIQDKNLSKVEECVKSEPDALQRKDSNGMLPIHWAADGGEVSIVEFLINKGVDINQQDSDGQTGLHYACSVGHENVIKLFLKHNIKTDLTDNDGQTAIDLIDKPELKALFN